MRQRDGVQKLHPNQLEEASGGNYWPGSYKEESRAFLKAHMDEKTFNTIMNSADARRHPYVAAKIFLSPLDWERFVWIEHHGSLDGFSG